MSNNTFQDLNPDQKRDVEKLERKYNSLKSQNGNFSEQLWNAFTDLCRAKGEVGLNMLNEEKKKLIDNDYQKKVKFYQQSINQLYQKYYDKIDLLSNLKKTNNQQIEMINNSQYKILQQKNIKDKVLNESTTQNRLSLFYNKQFRLNLKSVHNIIYLIIAIFTILIIIFTINSEDLKSDSINNKMQKAISYVINKKELLLSLIIITLFMLIVFKTYNLVILLLIFYSIFIIFS